jgi:hypothetical protein
MNRILLVFLGTIALTVVACRSSEDSASKEKEMTEMQKPPDPGPGVPPGHCRVVAEVVRLDDCPEAPCSGAVKISEVLGYGSAFNAPLPTGSEVAVLFTKTVKGLKQGSIFQADLANATVLIKGSKDEQPSFTVSSYVIR